ncbi:MAG: S8 family serine peptidase [Candidatus Sumerlaeia bacterium]
MATRWMAFCLFVFATAAAAQPAPMPNVAAGVTRALAARGKADVIVRLDPAADRSLIDKAAIKGWTVQRRLESVPYLIGQVDSAGIAELAANPAVDQVYEDLTLRGSLAQSVPAITADVARTKYGLTGSNVVVGFIDTGIDLTHADLASAVQASRRIIKGDSNTSNVQDDNGHGTHLAGIITGNGSVAPRGVASDCKLVVIKALDSSNSGYMSDFITAIDWMIANKASFPSLKFISLSANFNAEPSTLCPCDSLVGSVSAYQAFLDVIARAKAAGMYLVVPTGNNGTSGLVPPACFKDVIAVGSCFDTSYLRAPGTNTYQYYDPSFPAVYNTSPTIQTIAGFSNYGSCMDFVAPGYLITSDKLTGGTVNSFGTSVSAAHVVGALALLQQRAPKASAAQLVTALATYSKQIPDPQNSSIKYPLIDVAATAAQLGPNRADAWTMYK